MWGAGLSFACCDAIGWQRPLQLFRVICTEGVNFNHNVPVFFRFVFLGIKSIADCHFMIYSFSSFHRELF